MAQHQMSSRNNPYFDIDVKTSSSEDKRIWVMETTRSKRILFLQKHELKFLVKFTGLSPAKAEVSFYDVDISSRCEDLK